MNSISELLELISALGGTASVNEIALAYAKKYKMPLSLVSKGAISTTLTKYNGRLFRDNAKLSYNSELKKWEILSVTPIEEKGTIKKTGIIGRGDNSCAWLIPCNVNRYDPFEAFKNLKTIDWRQSTKVNPGDLVYIYVSKPYGKVMFKTIVIKSNIPPEEVDTSDITYNKEFREEEGPNPKFGYMRLQLISTADKNELTVDSLKPYGLKSAPQGPMKLDNRLHTAIDKHFKVENKYLLVCRLAYMKEYNGITDQDQPENGGSFVSENNDAFEKLNFHKYDDGYCYGFIETKYKSGHTTDNEYAKSINIDNLDPSLAGAEQAENVRIVFVAFSPVLKKTVVVGWYDNATVYRNRIVDGNKIYMAKCAATDAHLIPDAERHFEVPKAGGKNAFGIGQSNFWYIQKFEIAKKFEKKLTQYIESLLYSSELRRIVSADAFSEAYKKFIEQADKNAISGKSEGSKVPYGFSEKPECNGAHFKAQYGQGSASHTPYMNWWVVSIYYLIESQSIVVGIETERYAHIEQMTPLKVVTFENRKTAVAVFYESSKASLDYVELYEAFINTCEQVMALGMESLGYDIELTYVKR